ncbi:MAG: glycyl-radical enzyme activating protein [Clostridia bacterium]|nr:glycyl-radical enzyme activating protein [Clostridia bacterium]
MVKGKIFNLQRFSTDDGDGIRTSVFLKGCPLRCAWCHNAESLSAQNELAVYENNCIGCGACVKSCPSGIVVVENGKVRLSRDKCKRCFACTKVCPAEALVQIGYEASAEEIMETVLRDKVFYGESGGITITGGEPMAQPRFTAELARLAKSLGLSVVIETSGYGKIKDFEELLPFVDTFLFDCKASSEKHKDLTGVDDRIILENLDILCRRGAKVILRCPIVEGANLDGAFIEKIITLAKKYDAVKAVQLMPYHKTGAEKLSVIGKGKQQIFNVPSEEALTQLTEKINRESGKETFYN